MKNDFWIPMFKWQLVEWFLKHYNYKYSKSVLNKKSKKQLMGWYIDIRKSISTITIVIVFLILSNIKLYAYIPEEMAVRAIIGEASGEGYNGMLAIASALRRRGSLRGVYGIKAKHIESEPGSTWVKARKAWKEGKHKDITNGANGWGSKEDVKKFKKQKWWKKATVTKTIGNHVFYKA